MLELLLACLVPKPGGLKQDWSFPHGPGMRRSSEPVSSARVGLR